MIELANLSEPIREFFGATADQVASETGFVQRGSKVSGAHWMRTWVFGFLETPDATLNELAQVSTDLGVALTAQGIDGRLTESAERYLATMFRRCLGLFREHQAVPIEVLNRFTAVYLQDSTFIALPENLQAAFPGGGGDGPVAGLKLQVMVELRWGQWHLTVEAGNAPDQGYVTDVPAEAHSLRISDLGYFNLNTFAALGRREAYVLSRLLPRTRVYEAATGQELELLAWLQGQTATVVEAAILVGLEARFPMRLVVCRLPQEVADQRRARAQATAARKGRTVSPGQLALLDWNIYVTTAPAACLTTQEVLVLYRVRWQIELIFKVWKSEAWLDRVAGWKRARVMCELYAKLIGVTLAQLWMAPVRWATGELSLTKVFQSLQRYALRLALSLEQPQELERWLTQLQAVWLKFGRKDKRRTRQSTLKELQQLSQGQCSA
jgi:hypothetical protein